MTPISQVLTSFHVPFPGIPFLFFVVFCICASQLNSKSLPTGNTSQLILTLLNVGVQCDQEKLNE